MEGSRRGTYTTNIETVAADAYAAGKVLYPHLFSDLYLPAKAEAIYSFFLKKPVFGNLKKNLEELGLLVNLSSRFRVLELWFER